MSSQQLKEVATGSKKDNPIVKFSGFLDRLKPQMALALPKHLNPDRMARLALTAFSTTPKLQLCDERSIAGAIMTASTLGLEIGVNGQGFLVPYGKTCTFVPGWKGLVDLVSRSGRGTVWTGAVFDGDKFDYELGDSPFVKHKPAGEDDPAKLLFVYSVGRPKGAEWPIIEVWQVEKVRKHRDKYNKVGGQHYSFRDWEMYARKVPLLQVIKYMPSSVELNNAIMISDAVDQGDSATLEGDFVTVSNLQDSDLGAGAGDNVSEIKPGAQADPDTGEVKHGGSELLVFTYAEANSGLTLAANLDQLDGAAGMIAGVPNPQHQKELNEVYKKRRAEIEGKA